MTDLITRALRNATDTRAVVIGEGAVERTGEVFTELFGTTRAVVVADERTFALAGKRVSESLAAAGVELADPHIFPGEPELYAKYENCEALRDALAPVDAIAVAVGSGTLNDITKRASGELGRPYMVVGTAASMDGYTGFGAPMTRGGLKITMPCPAPLAVIFDLDVAAAAPRPMAASGYGDLSAKIPAGADWMYADALGVEAIHPLAWELVQGGVREALAQPGELAAGVPEAYEGLCSGLVMSGLAMQVARGTRPASGAEHYFSHLWELDHLGAELDPPLSHGFKVAIGTLAMTSFHERFLARDLAGLDVDAAVGRWPSWEEIERDIRGTMSGPLIDKGINETREKYVDADALRVRIDRLVESWPRLRSRLRDQLMPAERLQRMLGEAGAPTRPEDIGLSVDDVRQAFPRAMYYRSRYTALDVAWELGLFEDLVAEVFEKIWV